MRRTLTRNLSRRTERGDRRQRGRRRDGVGDLAGEEEVVGVEEFVGEEVALGDEPDLALGIGEDEVALAGLGGVVHAEDFVDVVGVEAGVFDGVGAGDAAGVDGVDFDVEAGSDVHGGEYSNGGPGRGFWGGVGSCIEKRQDWGLIAEGVREGRTGALTVELAEGNGGRVRIVL